MTNPVVRGTIALAALVVIVALGIGLNKRSGSIGKTLWSWGPWGKETLYDNSTVYEVGPDRYEVRAPHRFQMIIPVEPTDSYCVCSKTRYMAPTDAGWRTGCDAWSAKGKGGGLILGFEKRAVVEVKRLNAPNLPGLQKQAKECRAKQPEH